MWWQNWIFISHYSSPSEIFQICWPFLIIINVENSCLYFCGNHDNYFQNSFMDRRAKEQHLFEMEMFCHFDQFNVSLRNKSTIGWQTKTLVESDCNDLDHTYSFQNKCTEVLRDDRDRAKSNTRASGDHVINRQNQQWISRLIWSFVEWMRCLVKRSIVKQL